MCIRDRLFADDQIPDESIPDGDLKRALGARNPHWDPGFILSLIHISEPTRPY